MTTRARARDVGAHRTVVATEFAHARTGGATREPVDRLRACIANTDWSNWLILLDQAGAGRGQAVVIAAPEHAASLVEHAFVQRYSVCGRGAWRVVPDTCASILVSISQEPSAMRCMIAGPRSRFGDVDVCGRRITCGLRLQLGALPAVFGMPAGDFTDCVVPLACLTGAAARTLRRRLDDPSGIPQVLRALYAFVAESSRGRTPACDPRTFAGVTRVSELGRRTARAARSTYNRVVAQVGLSPKAVLRVHRLHRALHTAAAGATWSEAAFAAGFADQSHLTRESRRLLGETPAQWQRRRGCRFVQDRRGGGA